MFLAVCLVLPLTVCAQGLTAAQKKENKSEVYAFLTNTMKCNTATACGIMANIQSESSFDPEANCIDTNGLTSFGLCQWNGKRNAQLQDYCERQGLDYRSVAGQLQFMWYELKNGESAAWSAMQSFPNTTDGAYQAGYTWASKFERCAKVYWIPRAELAQTYFEEYGGVETTDTTTDTATDTTTDTIPSIQKVDMGGLEQNTATYTVGQFSDVSAAQWFNTCVAVAVKKGLIQGDAKGRFKPYGNVTIAEAVTMACRVHSRYYNDGETFVKTDASWKWYQPYMDYAYINNIIEKDLYTISDPTAPATRAQFVQILYSALPDAALPKVNTVNSGDIPDVSITASYAAAVYVFYRAGILTGDDDGKRSFKPTSAIQRSEAAAILARIADSTTRKAFVM